MQNAGKILIAAGVLMAAVGILMYFFGTKLHWIGRLPGDIRIEKESFRFYFPITTMIIASILISLVFHLIKRFF